jgi:RNA polymerase sigma-70 factor (ECF subfamily)
VNPSDPRRFATTQWSLVGAANLQAASQTRARAALEQLCRAYWYPLYAFVRGRGHSAIDAQDLTQAFFASVLEAGGFAAAERGRGRFRSYLLGAMKHFLTNEWHKQKAQKRGGGVELLEWDALDPERRLAELAAPGEDLDLVFDRQWALETTGAALTALREEMEGAGQRDRFALLKGCLAGQEEAPRAELAARLGLTENALKVAIHRLRQRYRVLLRAAIAETVSDEAELEEELRYLVSVLRGGTDPREAFEPREE